MLAGQQGAGVTGTGLAQASDAGTVNGAMIAGHTLNGIGRIFQNNLQMLAGCFDHRVC